MLIANAIQQVHLLSQGDTSYPSSGEDDFALILAAINNGINIWETQEGISWNELCSTETGVITQGDSTYALSSTFKWPSALLSINGLAINYQKPEESALSSALGSLGKRFYISGAVTQKVLNILPTPAEDMDGAPWELPCYNFATYFTTGEENTHLQMSDPYFAIHHAVSMISLEDNPTLASIHQQIAGQKLAGMRIANEAKPYGSREARNDDTPGFGVAG